MEKKIFRIDANKINISLTKNQFEELFKLVCIGEWIINADFIDEYEKEASGILEHFCDIADKSGLEHLVQKAKDIEGIFPSVDFEDMTIEYIQRYEDNFFWSRLEQLLIQRDFRKMYSEEEIKNMDDKKLFNTLLDIEGAYAKEFEEYGIENLYINKTQNITVH